MSDNEVFDPRTCERCGYVDPNRVADVAETDAEIVGDSVVFHDSPPLRVGESGESLEILTVTIDGRTARVTYRIRPRPVLLRYVSGSSYGWQWLCETCWTEL